MTCFFHNHGILTMRHAVYQSSQAKPSSQRTSRTFTGQRSTDYSVPARQVMAPRHSKNQWKICSKISQIDVKFWKIYVIFSSGSKMPPDTQLRQNVSKLGKFTAKMSGACSWPSGASTPPNLCHVKKIANVRRIGTLTDRDTDLRFGEHFGIFDEF